MQRNPLQIGITLGALGAALALPVPEANAAQQRSFVASGGNDAANCQLVTPCRSFNTAIANTIAGGEVIALDSAGYGPFSITGPITVMAPPGVYAGISVSSGDGVTINAGAGDRIVLRGLNIVAVGAATNAILFQSGKSLVVTDCNVTGMPFGIAFQPAATATLFVSNSHFLGGAGGTRGITVSAATGVASANLEAVHVEGYSAGIYGGDNSKINIFNTVSTLNFNNYQLVVTSASVNAEMNITRSVSSYSANAGVRTSGAATAVARVSDSVIVDENNNAVASFNGSTILTRSNNTGEGSTSGPFFGGTFTPK